MASQTSAMALMKEILVARKEFAEVFTSSAVGKSVTTKGEPSETGVAYTSRRIFSARSLRTCGHETVGVQRVLDGEALTQKLRVPGELGVLAAWGELGERARQPLRGAHRHGGLADDEGGAQQMRGERLEGGVDVRHVARVLPVLLRRVHADEVDVAELPDLGPVHGEAQ